MTFSSARGATVAILLASLAGNAWCQDTGLPGLIPLPPLPTAGHAVSPAAATDALTVDR